MAELIFKIFGLILVGTFVIETIQAMKDEIDDACKLQWDDQPAPRYDEFEMLYMNVADGDSSDSDYWLAGVRGGKNDDKN